MRYTGWMSLGLVLLVTGCATTTPPAVPEAPRTARSGPALPPVAPLPPLPPVSNEKSPDYRLAPKDQLAIQVHGQDDLTRTVQGPLEPLLQARELDVTTNQDEVLWTKIGGGRGLRRRRHRSVNRLHHGNRSDKTVAAMRNGFHEARGRRIVLQNISQLTNAPAEHAFADHGRGPGGCTQLLSRDQPSGLFDQAQEHGKQLGTERHELRSPPQLLAGGVQPEWGKDELTVRHSFSVSRSILEALAAL